VNPASTSDELERRSASGNPAAGLDLEKQMGEQKHKSIEDEDGIARAVFDGEKYSAQRLLGRISGRQARGQSVVQERAALADLQIETGSSIPELQDQTYLRED
jgi:hypothetical protein